jgi:hypothetical protein
VFQLVARRHFGGVVKGPNGDALPGIDVGWRRVDGGTWDLVGTDGKGVFECSDVGSGAVFVKVFGAPDPADFARHLTGDTFEAGTRLTIDSRASITFEASAPLAQRAEMRFGGPGVGKPLVNATGVRDWFTSDRPTHLANLEASATYSAYFGPTPDGKIFYAEGLRPQGQVVPVALERGVVVRAHVVGLTTAMRRNLEVGIRRNAITVTLPLAGDSVDVVPLPVNTRWTLYARGPGVSAERTKEFDVVTDAVVELDLR